MAQLGYFKTAFIDSSLHKDFNKNVNIIVDDNASRTSIVNFSEVFNFSATIVINPDRLPYVGLYFPCPAYVMI